MGGGAVALLQRPDAATPAAAPRAAVAPEARTSIEIGVQVNPPGVSDLEMSIGGVPVSAQTPHRVVPRANAALLVRVNAPGYRSVELPVVPDRDRTLMVTLVPLPPVVRAGEAERAKPAASRPAPAASGVIRRYPF
jgi:hypothetical protein